jgi:micrococcal nuclease
VRLQGIDAPEARQPFGTRAKQFASSLVIMPDGRNLSHELVRAGFAWWFQKYSTDATLKALESEAREAHRGLWADPSPVAPWDWRQTVRQGT